MSQKLSQAEIDKLLNTNDTPLLTEEEIDMLGEIGNIGMGNSATALSQILNRKVNITTPKVLVLENNEMPDKYAMPYVTVEINYIEGLEGKNVLNLKCDDVKLITNIMMGGKGEIKEGPIDELHLSAAGEMMNQMIGSSSTALAEMMNIRLNISTPDVLVRDYSTEHLEALIEEAPLVMTVFNMTVEDVLDSEIMLVMSIDFAKEMVEKVKYQYSQTFSQEPVENTQVAEQANDSYSQNASLEKEKEKEKEKVNVQKVELQTFGEKPKFQNLTGNRYNVLMDVPLEVTIEIGRVKKPISEILKFTSGTIIELDKLVGEDLNILINNKIIGKGEVVVIDEHYGMRVSEILDNKE